MWQILNTIDIRFEIITIFGSFLPSDSVLSHRSFGHLLMVERDRGRLDRSLLLEILADAFDDAPEHVGGCVLGQEVKDKPEIKIYRSKGERNSRTNAKPRTSLQCNIGQGDH